MFSQSNPKYPKSERIRIVLGLLGDLWSACPESTFMALVEDVLGSCHRDECARLLDDAEFESRLKARLVEMTGGK